MLNVLDVSMNMLNWEKEKGGKEKLGEWLYKNE